MDNNVENQTTNNVCERKPRKGLIIGIISAVVSAVVAFVGYAVYKNNKNTKEVVEIESETENVEE